MIVLVAAVITAAIFVFPGQMPWRIPSPKTMKSVTWEMVSSETLDKLTEQSAEISEDEFDLFYDTVVEVLKRHGTFSDGGLEPASFSSSRYVDQCTCMGVVSERAVDDALALDVAHALKQYKDTHYVYFDGALMCCITSDGRFLKAVD